MIKPWFTLGVCAQAGGLISCPVSAPIYHLRCVLVSQCVMEDDSCVLTIVICKSQHSTAQGHTIICSLTLYKRKIMRQNFSKLVTFYCRQPTCPSPLLAPSPVQISLIVSVLVPAPPQPPQPCPVIHCLQPSAFSNLTIREVTALCTSAFSNWICCRNSRLENFIFAPGGCVRVCVGCTSRRGTSSPS